MRRIVASSPWLLTAVAMIGLAGCGYPGDPLPPALNIPLPITDLRAVQRGDRIVVEFTPIYRSTDNLLLEELQSVELRIGPKPQGAFDLRTWEQGAKPFAVEFEKDKPVLMTVPSAQFVNQSVTVSARSFGPTGKPAHWSNTADLAIVPALDQPQDLKASAVPDGVRLDWQAQPAQPQSGWRIFRRDDTPAPPTKIAESQETHYVDATAEFGKSYTYAVQRFQVVPTGQAESVPSNLVPISPKDTFPPAVPQSVAIQQGLQSLELSWERNTEEDFRGYQVWRAEGEAPLQKLGELITAPAFSDSGIISQKRYRYAVSAVDASGNESAQSAPVSGVAP